MSDDDDDLYDFDDFDFESPRREEPAAERDLSVSTEEAPSVFSNVRSIADLIADSEAAESSDADVAAAVAAEEAAEAVAAAEALESAAAAEASEAAAAAAAARGRNLRSVEELIESVGAPSPRFNDRNIRSDVEELIPGATADSEPESPLARRDAPERSSSPPPPPRVSASSVPAFREARGARGSGSLGGARAGWGRAAAAAFVQPTSVRRRRVPTVTSADAELPGPTRRALEYLEESAGRGRGNGAGATPSRQLANSSAASGRGYAVAGGTAWQDPSILKVVLGSMLEGALAVDLPALRPPPTTEEARARRGAAELASV